MELGAIIVGLAMLVGSVPFVIKPFRERCGQRDYKQNIHPHPEENRQAILSALGELDFDFRTGKVGEDDYLALRAQLVVEAATYFESENIKTDEQIEAMIVARKALLSNLRECSNCGHKVYADSRFCSECGRAVPSGCPTCCKLAQEEDHFCTSCGVKLEHTLEAEA